MRIAVFSDVHGNSIALDAVLEDIKANGGVDAYWFLGDAAAMGPDPVGAIQRIMALPNIVAIRGNTDQYVVNDRTVFDELLSDLAGSDVEEARSTLKSLLGIAWTRGAVSVAGQFPWLSELPLDHRLTLPDGTRVLLVHARPSNVDGPGFIPSQTNEQAAELLGEPAADLVLVAHTHQIVDRVIGKTRVLNNGSVSMPVTNDKRAMWTLIEADTGGYRVERHFVAYDADAVFQALDRVHHPSSAFIKARWDAKS